MTRSSSFFAFNPRLVRFGLVVGAVACAMLGAWALANARAGAERFGVVRAGFAAGLMFAFAYAFVRLRPREGWGVSVDALALFIARPFSEEPIRLAWSEVSVVRRERPGVLAIFTKAGDRVLLPRHLFPGDEAFERMASEVSARVPPPSLDA